MTLYHRCLAKATQFPPDSEITRWCYEKGDKPYFEINCCGNDMCNKNFKFDTTPERGETPITTSKITIFWVFKHENGQRNECALCIYYSSLVLYCVSSQSLSIYISSEYIPISQIGECFISSLSFSCSHPHPHWRIVQKTFECHCMCRSSRNVDWIFSLSLFHITCHHSHCNFIFYSADVLSSISANIENWMESFHHHRISYVFRSTTNITPYSLSSSHYLSYYYRLHFTHHHTHTHTSLLCCEY